MTWLYFLFLQFQAAHREGATKHCGGWGRSPAWSLVLSLSVIEGNSPRYGGSPAEDLRRIAQLAAARSSGWYSLWNRASLPHMPGYGWSTVSPVPSSVERLSSPSPTLQCHLALCVEFAPWDLGTLQAAPWEYVHWIPSRRELTWLRRRMILCLPWLRTFRFCCCAWFLPQDLFLKKKLEPNRILHPSSCGDEELKLKLNWLVIACFLDLHSFQETKTESVRAKFKVSCQMVRQKWKPFADSLNTDFYWAITECYNRNMPAPATVSY